MCDSFVCSLSGNQTLLVLLGVSVVSGCRLDGVVVLGGVRDGNGGAERVETSGSWVGVWMDEVCVGVVVLGGLGWGTGWDGTCCAGRVGLVTTVSTRRWLQRRMIRRMLRYVRTRSTEGQKWSFSVSSGGTHLRSA